MFDFRQFTLLSPTEYQKGYQFQERFLSNARVDEVDLALRLAILISAPPIGDFDEANRLLVTYYRHNPDIRVGILGAYLSAQWPSAAHNIFLQMISERMQLLIQEHAAIVHFLYAYNMFMRDEVNQHRQVYIGHLKQSIDISDQFVYNYYHLAQVSTPTNARSLMRIALGNVTSIIPADSLGALEELTDYDNYIAEHITGTKLSCVNYQRFLEFQKSLDCV
jgi:hypothetical protein